MCGGEEEEEQEQETGTCRSEHPTLCVQRTFSVNTVTQAKHPISILSLVWCDGSVIFGAAIILCLQLVLADILK